MSEDRKLEDLSKDELVALVAKLTGLLQQMTDALDKSNLARTALHKKLLKGQEVLSAYAKLLDHLEAIRPPNLDRYYVFEVKQLQAKYDQLK